MKFHVRGVAAVVLAAVLSIQVAPLALAYPRERDGFEPLIVRFLKTLKRFVGITTNDDGITGPKP